MIAGALAMPAAWLLTVALAGPVNAQERSSASANEAASGNSLERAFQDPPAEARPRVWWHWMNGNITKDGIRKDLEWMKRSGIAGFQNFDADIQTPQIVEKRLAFMSPGWKDAFRFAASEADRLGLEMAIASSPGFSVTGGAWVRPRDAMKKLAWSETIVQGGRAFRGKLAKPPETTGPFQDAPLKPLLAPLIGEKKLPSFYQDAMVFAYRVSGERQSMSMSASMAGKPLDTALLTDRAYTSGVKVPKGPVGTPTIVNLTLDEPQAVRSVTYFARGAFQIFQPGVVLSRLEASEDGATWRKVVDLGVTFAPVTISFAPVEAKHFRLVMMTLGGTGPAKDPDAAPGVDPSPFEVFKRSPDIELVELRLSTEPRIDRWQGKAGFANVATGAPSESTLDPREPGVAVRDVVDLTGRMGADGTLNWTPPRGTWRVVRMGWSLLGTTNHPAAAEATGLEVDKADRTAVRRYLETYLGMYRDAAGADLIGERGVQALLTDSTEAGSFNWTPGLLEHFERLRGYDPRPWLPALTGAIVESRERSDQFLYDYRRTLGDLYATEHYGTVAQVAHEHGLKVYGEALEGASGLGDDLDMRRYADIPMAAQWMFARQGKPAAHHEADMRGAASVGHVYGKNIVAAEALTSQTNPWGHAPADLRRTMDLIFASGVNRPVIHTSLHVPRDDKAPGLSLWIYGQYFNRLDTWAEMARPWIDYIARSSLMLQAGEPVADIAYFYGEEMPLGAMAGAGLIKDLPKGNAYDFVSAKAVGEDLKVEDGDLVAPSGARYRLLQLGGSSERMTLPTLRRVAALAEQGATILGDAPKRSPGLDGDSPEYARLVQKLWSGGDVTQVGKGRVIAGRDVEKALDRIGVRPDFGLLTEHPNARVMFVHRRIADGDIYFVTHRGKQGERLEARFRVTGKAPEIWRADDATISPASYRIEGDHTVVPLDMRAEDSLFVVFRRNAVAPSRTVAAETASLIAEVEGPWHVAFQPGHGAPASTTLARLGSLSDHSDPGIKYFSGVSTYTKTIEAPRSYVPGRPLLIDLGTIGDVAEVRINGQLAGTAWQAPYRVDIGRFMKRGRNQLDIRVANLWVNRLIGDQQPGATRITYTGTPTYTADAPLRPSGLIGPVRLLGIDR